MFDREIIVESGCQTSFIIYLRLLPAVKIPPACNYFHIVQIFHIANCTARLLAWHAFIGASTDCRVVGRSAVAMAASSGDAAAAAAPGTEGEGADAVDTDDEEQSLQGRVGTDLLSAAPSPAADKPQIMNTGHGLNPAHALPCPYARASSSRTSLQDLNQKQSIVPEYISTQRTITGAEVAGCAVCQRGLQRQGPKSLVCCAQKHRSARTHARTHARTPRHTRTHAHARRLAHTLLDTYALKRTEPHLQARAP
eukprot:6192540-Pleurochrysis_carterae.AAC.2